MEETKTSILYDMGEYKENILAHLLKNEDLAKVLLRKKNPTEEEINSLEYTQVFPFLYISNTQDDAKSYVCFEVEISCDGNIKVMTLTAYIYANKNCMNYFLKGYKGTTVDILSDIFVKQVEDCKDFGIGKWDLSSTWHTFPNSDYYGKTITLRTQDFKNKVKRK